MTTTMIVWLSVAAFMAGLVASRLVKSIVRARHGRRPIIELGSEREEIWVPGDELISEQGRNLYSDEI